MGWGIFFKENCIRGVIRKKKMRKCFDFYYIGFVFDFKKNV